MKRPFFLLSALALMLAPTMALASSHREPILAMFGDGVIAGWIATLWDNVAHFAEHVWFTAQIIVSEGPFAAMMMLDGVCFSAVPPWSHIFFATGVGAVLTTLIVVALLAVATWRTLLWLTRATSPRHQSLSA